MITPDVVCLTGTILITFRDYGPGHSAGKSPFCTARPGNQTAPGMTKPRQECMSQRPAWARPYSISLAGSRRQVWGGCAGDRRSSAVDRRLRFMPCRDPLGGQHDEYKDSKHAHAGAKFGHVVGVRNSSRPAGISNGVHAAKVQSSERQSFEYPAAPIVRRTGLQSTRPIVASQCPAATAPARRPPARDRGPIVPAPKAR